MLPALFIEWSSGIKISPGLLFDRRTMVLLFFTNCRERDRNRRLSSFLVADALRKVERRRQPARLLFPTTCTFDIEQTSLGRSSSQNRCQIGLNIDALLLREKGGSDKIL